MTDDRGEVIEEEQPLVGVFTIQSSKVDLIVPALVEAQSEMNAVPTNAENTFYKRGTGQNAAPYRYADLAAVREACVPILAKHKIAVIQGTIPRAQMTCFERSDNKNVQCMGDLCTQLLHVSGQWLAFKTPIVCDWSDVQKVAATTTYLRRSGLAAITGLAQQDDDGETARGRGGNDRQPATSTPRTTPEQKVGNGQHAATPPTPAPQSPAKPAPESGGRRFFKWLVDNKKKFPETQLIETASNISVDLGFSSHIVDLDEQQSRKVYTLLNDYLQEMAQAAPEEEVPA